MIGLALWLSLVVLSSALVTSLASAAGLWLARPLLDRLEPRGRARTFLFAALAPLVVAALTSLAVLLPHPWLGLPEHCAGHEHEHLHLCLAHGAPTPSLVLLAVVLLGAARVVVELGLALLGARRAARALGHLLAAGRATPGGAMRLPLELPLAFTAGLLRPRVFLSAPVADGKRFLAVLAHEQDHARHRDPLARLVVRLAASLHAPGVGRWLGRELAAAQEHAADEHAAGVLGDRLEVAAQIVAFAREASAAPHPSFAAFGEEDVERRVAALLRAPRTLRGPSLSHGLWLLAGACVLAIGAASSIHHVLEDLLALAS